ncbi:hypothetical protein [Streptomyces viridosporus]|uniref:hypothetical protein n=1 Tax=Streptomyces viridosporus TaxID=67581 RepID=UPI0036F6B888
MNGPTDVGGPTGTEPLDEVREVAAQIPHIGRLQPDLPAIVSPPELEIGDRALRRPVLGLFWQQHDIDEAPPTLRPMSTKIPITPGRGTLTTAPANTCPNRKSSRIRSHRASAVTPGSSHPRPGRNFGEPGGGGAGRIEPEATGDLAALLAHARS